MDQEYEKGKERSCQVCFGGGDYGVSVYFWKLMIICFIGFLDIGYIRIGCDKMEISWKN